MTHGQTYKVFYADELERVPANVEVVQGFNTLITAYDLVEVATLGRPELLTVTRINDNTIQLNTQSTGGVFGMTLVVGGRVQQFTVRIGGGLYNRTYAIYPSRIAGMLPANPVQAPLAPIPTSKPAPTGPTSPKVTSHTSGTPKPATPEATDRWLLVRVNGGQTISGSGDYVINFSLENLSERRISADIAHLVVRQAGREKEFSVSRVPSSALIEPKAVQAGSILVRGVAPGELELEWTLMEIGENPRTLILKRTLNTAATSE